MLQRQKVIIMKHEDNPATYSNGIMDIEQITDE